jgi:hypothetical protein
MKKERTIFSGINFFPGVICSIALMALISLAVPCQSQTVDSRVSLDLAKQYYQNYITAYKPSQDTLKGFFVSFNQLVTLDSLMRRNPTLSGCRIYLAKDNSKADVMLVVGVDNKGKDVATSGTYSGIYMTSPVNTGPCPKMCDVTSPITNH